MPPTRLKPHPYDPPDRTGVIDNRAKHVGNLACANPADALTCPSMQTGSLHDVQMESLGALVPYESSPEKAAASPATSSQVDKLLLRSMDKKAIAAELSLRKTKRTADAKASSSSAKKVFRAKVDLPMDKVCSEFKKATECSPFLYFMGKVGTTCATVFQTSREDWSMFSPGPPPLNPTRTYSIAQYGSTCLTCPSSSGGRCQRSQARLEKSCMSLLWGTK